MAMFGPASAASASAEGAEVIDQPAKTETSSCIWTKCSTVGSVMPVGGVISSQPPWQERERGSQFVGDVGGQVATGDIIGLEAVRHGIEGAVERADLAGRVVLTGPRGGVAAPSVAAASVTRGSGRTIRNAMVQRPPLRRALQRRADDHRAAEGVADVHLPLGEFT